MIGGIRRCIIRTITPWSTFSGPEKVLDKFTDVYYQNETVKTKTWRIFYEKNANYIHRFANFAFDRLI